MKNKKVAVFLSTAVAAVSGALLYHKKKKQKEDKKANPKANGGS